MSTAIKLLFTAASFPIRCKRRIPRRHGRFAFGGELNKNDNQLRLSKSYF
jgi:hypothetical protein